MHNNYYNKMLTRFYNSVSNEINPEVDFKKGY